MGFSPLRNGRLATRSSHQSGVEGRRHRHVCTIVPGASATVSVRARNGIEPRDVLQQIGYVKTMRNPDEDGPAFGADIVPPGAQISPVPLGGPQSKQLVPLARQGRHPLEDPNRPVSNPNRRFPAWCLVVVVDLYYISIRLPGAGLIFSSGNRRKWTEPPGKLLHDEVVPAQICRHRGVGLCGCEGVGNEGRLAGRRTCAEHVAVESAHGRLAVPLSPRQLVGASSAATVGPGGSLAGRWVWRLPRRIPVPHGGARPRGSRRWRRRDEDTRRGPTPRTAASCLVAFPPLAAKPTGRGLGRRRDGAD